MNNYLNNDLAKHHDYISNLQLGDAILPGYNKELRGEIVKIWNGRYQVVAMVPESNPNTIKLYAANGSTKRFEQVKDKWDFFSELTSEEAADWKQFLYSYSKILKNNK